MNRPQTAGALAKLTSFKSGWPSLLHRVRPSLARKARIRVIHGHGTGALRRGIGEFLAAHPLVEKYSFETEEHGGKAITIVELQR